MNFRSLKSNKDQLLKIFKKNNILAQYHYIPIYKFNLFNKKINLNFYQGAENYYKNTFSLPIFFNFKFKLQKFIINRIKFFIKT